MSKNQSHGIQIEKLIKNEFELMPGKVSLLRMFFLKSINRKIYQIRNLI